jgi:hypothetical protein
VCAVNKIADSIKGDFSNEVNKVISKGKFYHQLQVDNEVTNFINQSMIVKKVFC